MKKIIYTCLVIALMAITGTVQAQLWNNLEPAELGQASDQLIKPQHFRGLQMNIQLMRQMLANAPQEIIGQPFPSRVILSLPLPDGRNARFFVVESPIMESGLAANFPEIKTYLAYGIDMPDATARLDLTPAGFHAMILSNEGSIFIDPFARNDTEHYISYFKSDFLPEDLDFFCQFEEQHNGKIDNSYLQNATLSVGTELRIYRTAISATGEYTQFHGGTVAQALAAITTTINRVSGVYEREVAVRLVLIDNMEAIIYTDPDTDPCDNNDASTLIGQSQTNIDGEIGDANYDVGHTFSTGAGGLAGLGVICRSGNKASGVTGRSNPIGDPYDIDYVAHELGHQFGANHTFNGTTGSCSGGNRNGSTAYEPGSGTTIMAYAGICSPQDLQPHSDDYFHGVSFDEIVAYSTQGSGNNCPDIQATGNTPPTITPIAGSFTIPISTPFQLTGVATDTETPDDLTYCWEEWDLGAAGAPDSPSGNAPIFRTFNPSANATRYFPKLSDIVNNTHTMGELLPTYSRTLNFRLTVRDNAPNGGGVDFAETTLAVTENAGPFVITAPNTPTEWIATTSQTVTWDVANTNQGAVNCQTVNILLTINGGISFDFVLAANTPNDGSQMISVPNNATTQGRIKIEAADNVFFDISDADITIVEATSPDFYLSVENSPQTICQPNDAEFTISVGQLLGFTDPVTLSVSGLQAGLTESFTVNPVTTPGTSLLTISGSQNVAADSYEFQILGQSGALNHQIAVQMNVLAPVSTTATLTAPANNATDVASMPIFSWQAVENAQTYEIVIATDAEFSSIVNTASALSETTYTPPTGLTGNVQYFWKVRAASSCGAGDYSEVFSFTTKACTAFVSTDVPVTISPSGTPTVTSEVTVTESFTIVDLNVLNLIITHSWINDLTATLTSPAGTVVELFSSLCGSGDQNMNINFDDDGTVGAIPCPPTDGGTYPPPMGSGTLSTFNGENSQGTWTLTISDGANQDGGQLDSWTLELCQEATSLTTWQGGTSGNETDWHTADNWDNGVPDASTNAVIVATTHQPQINANAICRDLQMNANTQLTLSDGFSLEASGNLTLKSPTGTGKVASLLDMNANGALTISGTSTVERQISATAWHMVAFPTSVENPPFSGLYVRQYDEASNAFVYLQASDNPTLHLLKGYSIWGNAAKLMSFSGSLNTGNQTIATTNSGNGWNMLGNPYPSAINWDLAISGATGINNAVYVWDNANLRYTTYIDGTGANGGSNVIPPMQAFFVKCTAAGSFGLTNAMRMHNSSQNFLKTASDKKELFITATAGGLSDEIVLRFKEEANASFNANLDAEKLFAETENLPQIAFKKDDKQLTISSIANFNESITLPISLKTQHNENISFAISKMVNIDKNIAIYLEDKQAKSMTDLRKENALVTVKGNANDRFVLHLKKAKLEVSQKVKIYAYKHKVYLEIPFDFEKASVSLFDVTGKKLASRQLSSAKFELETQLPQGTYFVKTIVDGKNFSQKVFID